MRDGEYNPTGAVDRIHNAHYKDGCRQYWKHKNHTVELLKYYKTAWGPVETARAKRYLPNDISVEVFG